MLKFIAPEGTTKVLDFLTGQVTLAVESEKKVQLARDLAGIFEITFQLRQSFMQLSSGQQQKVLLAAALINNPETILLDEPFGHLDPFTRKEILQFLFEYIRQREISVVMVTHDIADAMAFSDRLAIMNYGKIEQLGSPEEVAFRPANIFVAQFLGHKNFIPVKRVDEHSWQTPWGQWQYAGARDVSEAVMLIPMHAWNLDPDSLMQGVIEQKEVMLNHWCLCISWQERRYWALLNYSQGLKLLPQQLLGLTPLWAECQLLPL
jgi:ABC-type Fe3+/spermidine/putrescine transport system ATPase subunit